MIQAQPQLRFDRAHFKAFGASSLDFEVVYIVEDPAFNLYMDRQHAINLGLMREFEAMGVQFAFPTRTVHVAGALGTACIALVPPAQGLLWYWGVTGEATPWYESVRLVRRAPEEGWAGQVARAAAMLAEGERGTR